LSPAWLLGPAVYSVAENRLGKHFLAKIFYTCPKSLENSFGGNLATRF